MLLFKKAGIIFLSLPIFGLMLFAYPPTYNISIFFILISSLLLLIYFFAYGIVSIFKNKFAIFPVLFPVLILALSYVFAYLILPPATAPIDLSKFLIQVVSFFCSLVVSIIWLNLITNNKK